MKTPPSIPNDHPPPGAYPEPLDWTASSLSEPRRGHDTSTNKTEDAGTVGRWHNWQDEEDREFDFAAGISTFGSTASTMGALAFIGGWPSFADFAAIATCWMAIGLVLQGLRR